jgi:AcrR family transcriptional regulator
MAVAETMGRGSTKEGRDIILAAAVKNFNTRGYHGTSMRDIGADAGMTAPSIYHHFASKQLILQDIMVRALQTVISETREAVLAAGPSAEDQLRAIVKAWIRFHTQHQPEALVGASELRSLDREGRRLVVALRDEQEALFRAIIDRGVAGGEFGTQFGHEVARAVIAMGYAVSTWYRPDGPLSTVDLETRYADMALGMVWPVRSKVHTH